MAKKYYVVWQGRQTGIFTDWDTCRKQVDKFPAAKYKSFPTRAEAEAAFEQARSDWAIHYEQKIQRELRARQDSLAWYLDDCDEAMAALEGHQHRRGRRET